MPCVVKCPCPSKQKVSLFHLFGMESVYIVYLCGEVKCYVTANRVWDHNMLSKETTWPQPMITAVLMWNMLSVGCCQLWPVNMNTSEIKFWLIKETTTLHFSYYGNTKEINLNSWVFICWSIKDVTWLITLHLSYALWTVLPALIINPWRKYIYS